VQRNEAGLYVAIAEQTLKEKKFSDSETKKAYERGQLPPGRLDLRATRYAVKLFLSHWHTVGYAVELKRPVPRPWIIEHGGHADIIPVPNWPNS
jgi:hypothetical protein